ncbi:Putrescine importer PuuP [Thermoflavimicrobium daqui]|uniref:Putrescine importer PuuP n=2 Tax=Thermoflavimicrobium daqui TaxID=2137476 RepID=A0A364K1F7_9BACL|nr:Putrescine importer PuuP [Thermoflavimicrobium daqui]
MDPLVVFDSYGVVAQETKGHVALSYIVILVALLFTAYGYGQMVKAYPSAGSTYTYTQKSIHPMIGFLVGWSVLLDYLFLPMVNFAIGSAYLKAAFPKVPHAIWVFALAAIVTIINILGVKLTANMNTLFVTFQTLVLIVFVGFVVKGLISGMGQGTLVSISPFYTANIDLSLIMTGASILCFSFLGFDAVTTLSEETLNPKKTIPRAIFLIALIGGVLFTATSYFLHLIHPNYLSFKSADAASLEIASYIGGAFLHSFFLVGTMVAVFSSSLSSSTSASRLLFAMGREGSFPKIFAYLHPKWKTPVFNLLLIGFISLTAIFGELEVIYSFISFGALIGFLFVNLSVIFHYYLRQKRRKGFDFVRYFIVPLIGAAFTLWLFTSLNLSAMALGFSWLIIGVLYSVIVSKRKKELAFKFDKG